MLLRAFDWTGVKADVLRSVLGFDHRRFARLLGGNVRARDVRAWSAATAAHTVLSPNVTGALQRCFADLTADELAAFHERLADVSDATAHPSPTADAKDLPAPLAAWAMSTGALRKDALAAGWDFFRALLRWDRVHSRRDLLAVLAATVAAFQAMYPDADPEQIARPVMAATGAHRADRHVIADLWAMYWICRRNDDRLGPHSALATASTQHALTEALLGDCPSDLRQDLQMLHSSWSATLAWIYFDLEDNARARFYHRMAITSANAADSPHARAMALANHAYVLTRGKTVSQSIDAASDAVNAARTSGDPRLEAFALTRMAYACAVGNERHRSDRVLASAHDLVARLPRDGGPISAAYFVDPGFVWQTASQCALITMDNSRAVATARQALDSQPPGLVRNNALSYARYALALARARQPSEACEQVVTAAHLALTNTSPRLRSDIRHVRWALKDFEHLPAVADLDETLTSLGLGLVHT